MKQKKQIRKEVLGVRVHPWLRFRTKKLAEYTNKSLSYLVSEALQIHINSMNIPEKTMNQWLEEYRKENPDNVD